MRILANPNAQTGRSWKYRKFQFSKASKARICCAPVREHQLDGNLESLRCRVFEVVMAQRSITIERSSGPFACEPVAEFALVRNSDLR